MNKKTISTFQMKKNGLSGAVHLGYQVICEQ